MTRFHMSVATGVVLLCGSALADTEPQTQPAGDPYGGQRYGAGQIPKSEIQQTAGEEIAPAPPPVRHKMGWQIMVGGGVTDFSKNGMRDLTSVGGEYEARVALGTRSIIGLEAAYVGTAQNITALGLDSSAWLASNSVEGLLRINVGTFMVQPFLFGGVSYVRYNVENASFNQSDVANHDDTLGIPFGGGISVRIGHTGALLDGRFTYRPIFSQDLVRADANGDARIGGEHDLDNWTASLRIGWEF